LYGKILTIIICQLVINVQTQRFKLLEIGIFEQVVDVLWRSGDPDNYEGLAAAYYWKNVFPKKWSSFVVAKVILLHRSIL